MHVQYWAKTHHSVARKKVLALELWRDYHHIEAGATATLESCSQSIAPPSLREVICVA